MSEIPQPIESSSQSSELPPLTDDEILTRPFMHEAVEVEEASLSLDDALKITGPAGLAQDDYMQFVGGKKRDDIMETYYRPFENGLLSRTNYPLLDVINPSAEEEELKKRTADQQQVDLNSEPYAMLRMADGRDSMVDKTKAEFLRIQRAYMRVTRALEKGEITDDEQRVIAELTLNKQQYEMTKLRMITASKELNWSQDASSRHLAAEKFKEASETLYGTLDRGAINGIVLSELLSVASFVPRDEDERKFQENAAQLLNGILGVRSGDTLTVADNGDTFVNGVQIEVTRPEIDPETMRVMTPIIMEKFRPALDAWPQQDFDKMLSAEEIVECFKVALSAMGLEDLGCKINLLKDESYIEASGPTREINIGGKCVYDSGFAFSIFAHEYGHLVRSVEAQEAAPEVGTLINGTPGYLPAEEGLNAFTQLVLLNYFGKPPEEIQIWQDRYLVYALGSGADGRPRAAYETLKDATTILTIRKLMNNPEFSLKQAAAKAAVEMTGRVERFYRGTLFSDPGVLYTKDKVYYDGLVRNLRFFNELVRTKTSAEIIKLYDRMYLGKHDHTNADEHEAVMKVFGLAE